LPYKYDIYNSIIFVTLNKVIIYYVVYHHILGNLTGALFLDLLSVLGLLLLGYLISGKD